MVTLRIDNSMEIVTHKKLRNEKIKPRSKMIQTLLYPDFRRSGESDLCTGVTFLLLISGVTTDLAFAYLQESNTEQR